MSGGDFGGAGGRPPTIWGFGDSSCVRPPQYFDKYCYLLDAWQRTNWL